MRITRVWTPRRRRKSKCGIFNISETKTRAEDTRIDKYLWAIRVFKTRNEATQACKGGKIRLNGGDVKPSKAVKPGDVIAARKGAVTFTYRVLALSDKRMGAKLVPDFAENITPQAELDKLRHPVETFFLKRDPGAGRPTKKDRRQMETLWDSLSFEIPDDVSDRLAAQMGFDFDDEDDDIADEI